MTLCDACGSTALHYAAIHHEAHVLPCCRCPGLRQDEMCGLLLKAAADPGQRDAKGLLTGTRNSDCTQQMSGRSPRDIAQLGGVWDANRGARSIMR